MNCKKCNSGNYIKKGLRNNTQLFYCKDCQSYFQSVYKYRAYNSDIDELIVSGLSRFVGTHFSEQKSLKKL